MSTSAQLKCEPSDAIEVQDDQEAPPFGANFIIEVPSLHVQQEAQQQRNDVVSQARQSFTLGRTAPVRYRKQQLAQLMLMYEEHDGTMKDVLARDLGKAGMEAALFEIDFLKNDLRNVLSNFQAWLRPENTYRRLMDMFAHPLIYRDALGVVLIVGAWNYPLQSTLLPLASAIAAGNCALIRPPPEAKHTAKFLREMLPAYLDHLSYFIIDNEEACCAAKVDYVFYTGPLQPAKTLQAISAQHLTPGTYVVGGKNPVYLDDTVNLHNALKRILWGKCVNAGQTCIGPGYLLCTTDLLKRVLLEVPKIIAEFYGDNPQASKDYARIISIEHFDRLVELMMGKDIAYGGEYDRDALYIQPTIVTNVTLNDALLHDETYGPILPIVPVKDLQEAVMYLRAREKPLALYIFSNDKRSVEHLLMHTSSGGVTVNDVLMHIAAESLPFGGVGSSGMGAYHGKKTFDTFTHPKSVLKKSLNCLVDRIERVRYPPYTNSKLLMVTQLMKKRPSIGFGWMKMVTIFVFGLFAGLFFGIFLG